MDLTTGVNITDLPTMGSSGVASAPYNRAGLVIGSERGTNMLHMITSLAEAVSDTGIGTVFGRYVPEHNGAYCLRGLFNNLGNAGAMLWVYRPTPDDAEASSVTVDNENANPAWKFTAGRLGLVDVGSWGNRLRVLVTDSSRGGSLLSPAGALSGSETYLSVNSPDDFLAGDRIVVNPGGAGSFETTVTGYDESTNALLISPANAAANVVDAGSEVAIKDRTIKIYVKDAVTGLPDLAETWSNVSNADNVYNAATLINNVYSGSRHVTFGQLVTAEAGTAADMPAGVVDDYTNASSLIGGLDGSELTQDEQNDALAVFDDTVPIMLLTNTETFTVATHGAGEFYCRTRADVRWVGAAPYGTNYEAGRAWAQQRRATRRFYTTNSYDWLNVSTSAGSRDIPPVGHYIGHAMNTWDARGIHKVPADPKRPLEDVLGLAYELKDINKITVLGDLGLNCATTEDGAVYFRSSKTPSKMPEYRNSNVIDTANFLKNTFRAFLKPYENEPLDENLLVSSVRSDLSEFGRLLFQSSTNGVANNSAFFSGPEFEDVFKLTVEARTVNTPQGPEDILYVEARFAAAGVANKILIGVGVITIRRAG